MNERPRKIEESANQPFASFQYPKKQQKREPFDGLPLLLV